MFSFVLLFFRQLTPRISWLVSASASVCVSGAVWVGWVLSLGKWGAQVRSANKSQHLHAIVGQHICDPQASSGSGM